MRLLIATPLYPPEIGGPATDASSLVAYLETHGDSVVVVSFSSVKKLPKVLRHGAYFFKLLKASSNVSAIVAFDLVSVGVAATLVARLKRIPLVVRVPGDYAWEQGTQRFGVTDTIEDFQRKRYGWRVELLRTLQRFTTRHAALVLVISDYFMTIISSWGIAEDRLQRVYLGLPDESDTAKLPDGVRGIGSEDKIMFSLGRFVPWKGFPLIVDLLAAFPEWHAVIAGDGPEFAHIQEYAKEKGVSERLLLPGRIPRDELLGWYQRANAFVLNTSQENFSYQILEALFASSAIISTNVGSIPELVRSEVDGVLCDPNDFACFSKALTSIETEPEAWRARRAAARERAQDFSIERSAQLTAEAIQRICV